MLDRAALENLLILQILDIRTFIVSTVVIIKANEFSENAIHYHYVYVNVLQNNNTHTHTQIRGEFIYFSFHNIIIIIIIMGNLKQARPFFLCVFYRCSRSHSPPIIISLIYRIKGWMYVKRILCNYFNLSIFGMKQNSSTSSISKIILVCEAVEHILPLFLYLCLEYYRVCFYK